MVIDISALLALGAAFSWTLAALFSHRPANELGSLHFNRVRMIAAVLIMLGLLVLTGRPMDITLSHLWLIALSSITGVVFGDFFLFAALRRIGPRRTNVLFATNAVFAELLGWVILGEALTSLTGLAILCGFCGVVLAVIYGKRRDLVHQWETITPPLWIGVLLALLAAVFQALGVLAVRPVMADGADPVAVGLARVAIGAVVFWATFPFDSRMKGRPLFPRGRTLMLVVLNGLFGLGVGAAMLLEALEEGSVAMVTILSSTTPVLILPFIWAQTKRAPAPGAWIGAMLVVLCTWLLVF